MAGVEVPIKITTQGGQDAVKQFDAIEKNVFDARKELERFGDATTDATILRSNFKLLGMELKDTAKQARQLNDILDGKIDNPYSQVEKGLKDVEDQAERAKAALTSINSDSMRVNTADAAGDVSTGLGALGSAAGSLGAGRTGSFLQGAGDFAGALEQLPRLTEGFGGLSASLLPLAPAAIIAAPALYAVVDQFKDLRKSTLDLVESTKQQVELYVLQNNTVKDLGVDQLTPQIEELQTRIEAENIAINQLNGVFRYSEEGIVGVVGRLANLANGSAAAGDEIKDYNKSIEEQTAQLNILNAALAERQAQQAVQDLTAFRLDGLDKELQTMREIDTLTTEAAQQRIEDVQFQVDGQRRIRDELRAAYDQNLASLQNGGLDVATVQRLTAENEALSASMEDLQNSIANDQREVDRLTNSVLPLVQAREAEKAAADRQTATLKELASARDKSTAALRDIGQSLTDFVSSEKQAQARKAAEAQLKATRTAEEGLLKSRYDSLIAAREQAKSQQKLKDVEQDRVNKITDINIKFFNDSLKRTQEFYLKEKRSQEDANLQRLRLVEDLQADLFEASAANNVDLFVSRLRSGSRDIGRFDQDTSIDARRRAEDFALSNNDAIANRQKEVEAVQQASAAKLQAEQEAATKSLTLEQQYQAELATLKARYQQEDLRRQQEFDRQSSLARYNALITQLNEQQRLQVEAQKALAQNAAVAGQNAGVSLLNSFQQTVMRVANRGGVTNAAANVIPRVNFTAFGDGGNVTSPTFSLLGEREGWGDLVMPYKKSEGLPAGLSRPSITVDFRGANLGGISPEVLDNKLNIFASQIVNGLNQGFAV